MEFTEFAQKIKPIIGGSYSTHVFTKTLFESIIIEEGLLQIEDIAKTLLKLILTGKQQLLGFPNVFCPILNLHNSLYT